jgi:hypothetical protein
MIANCYHWSLTGGNTMGVSGIGTASKVRVGVGVLGANL